MSVMELLAIVGNFCLNVIIILFFCVLASLILETITDKPAPETEPAPPAPRWLGVTLIVLALGLISSIAYAV